MLCRVVRKGINLDVNVDRRFTVRRGDVSEEEL